VCLQLLLYNCYLSGANAFYISRENKWEESWWIYLKLLSAIIYAYLNGTVLLCIFEWDNLFTWNYNLPWLLAKRGLCNKCDSLRIMALDQGPPIHHAQQRRYHMFWIVLHLFANPTLLWVQVFQGSLVFSHRLPVLGHARAGDSIRRACNAGIGTSLLKDRFVCFEICVDFWKGLPGQFFV